MGLSIPGHFAFLSSCHRPTERNNREVSLVHYVYILVSESDPHRPYVGVTTNLTDRLARHNGGRDPHTAVGGPWRLRVAIAFPSREKAAAFERYLKTHSGRAFSSKHF